MRATLLSERSPDREHNEDGAFQVGNLVGVLDGVSVPPNTDTGCLHGPAWYVERLIARLEQWSPVAAAAPLDELVADAIASVRDDHGPGCDLDHQGTPAAAVGLLRVDDRRLDYLLLGDVTLVVDDGQAVQVLTDDRFDQTMAEIRAVAFAGAPTLGSEDQVERTRQAALHRQRFTNRPGGYWIAAATPEAAHYAVLGSLESRSLFKGAAALMTDGAADGVTRYGVADWPSVIPLLRDIGPAGFIRRVRQAEADDADGRQQPRYKRHDDATIAFCELDEETT